MYHWRLVQTLDEQKQKAWIEIASKQISSVHPKRLQGFALSREALYQCLENIGQTPEQSSLPLLNFSTLNEFPELTLSLTHTENAGGAILGLRSQYRSLGIDVELKTREVRDDVIEKLSNPKDGNLRNLEMWCLKEAAFKCLSNAQVLSSAPLYRDLEVQSSSWLHHPTGHRGDLTLVESDQFFIALASWSI